jgi:hypothetical protein
VKIGFIRVPLMVASFKSEAMNKIILFIAILTSGNVFAQTKDKSSVNVGLYRTDLYSKLFLYDKFCDEGCYATEQHAVTCFDLNYLRQANIGKKFFIPFGFGINQKGYSEKGFVNNLNENWDPYSATYKATYLSFYIGISYDLNVGKKLTINIGQLLNPKMLGGGDSEYKEIPISTRTNVSFSLILLKKYHFRQLHFLKQL